MIKLTHPSVASNTLEACLKILPLLTIAVLAFVFVSDVDARTRTRTLDTTDTSTSGGIDTPYSDHGVSTKCTWENFQGVWEATPGDSTDPSNPVPTQVTHFVGDKDDPTNVDYAVCGGFDTGSVPVGSLTNPDGTPNDVVKNAPYGWGYFYFDITYESAVASSCIVDPNSGHGNSCGYDPDNTGKGGKKNTTIDPGSVSCEPNLSGVGTTLTYKFSCAAGVSVTGFLTLVPTIGGEPQEVAFTKCGPARVAAGQCTILYGGFPLDKKGNLDTAACLEAFPDSDVPNGLNTTQFQHLAAGEILLYQEVSNEGTCDIATNLPTAAGAATAAYSRYCTSDIDTFEDNAAYDIYGEPNVFSDDPTSDDFSEHGFDNEFRACYKRKGSPYYHTGVQDVEKVELTDIMVDAGPTFNLNCTTGGNTDSGIYKVWISDQATLLAGRVDVTPLSDAPTLEGVSPTKAVITTDDFGVETLELVYPTCTVLTETIISNNNLDGTLNNTNVTLELIGQTEVTETSLDQTIKALIEVKVNGL